MDKNFKLPKGITGFTSINEYFEIPKTSEDLIIQAITDLVIECNNYVFIRLEHPNQNTNYYSINLIDKILDKKYIVLFNEHYNYICSLDEKKSWCEKKFGDLPIKIIKHMEMFGFKYLPKLILDKKISQINLSELAQPEKEQVKFWDSKTIGEVIFNHYD